MSEVVEALTPFARRQPVEFDFPKILAWRARDARRRFAGQRRTGGSSVVQPRLSSKPSKHSLHSSSTQRLPEASADTAISPFVARERSAISLIAPFEGTREETSLSRPEVPLVTPKGPSLTPLDGGAPVALVGPTVTIGRDPGCNLCVASTQVSARHCELRTDGNFWYVVDLGSKNGTEVNGAEVSEQILNPGDRLSLAQQFHFRIDYPADPRQTEGRLAHGALLGAVAAALALTAFFLWRLIG
jgi:hypothetical protein